MFSSIGILKYEITENAGYKLIVEVDQEIADYYRSLIPKWYKTSRQRYPAHISVVRKEIPPRKEFWGKYDGKEIEFVYSPLIYKGIVYWWINAFSNKLEEIRLEMGLPISSKYTRPPDGWDKVFHITIGNSKEL